MKNKKKLIILSSIIVGVLVIVLGLSYALFTFDRVGINQELVLGDIWMKYTESNGISLEDALPGAAYSKYFEFTITGKNTYTEKDIWYDIRLTKGDIPEGKTEDNRIEDEYLKFRLVEVNGDEEIEIFTDKTYEDLTNQIVHVTTIPKNTNEYSKTYRLYMVISEKLVIGNIKGAISSEEFETLFGSIKVATTGDFVKKELPKELKKITTALKEKVVSYSVSSGDDFSGGLVAINGTKGDDYGLLYNENNDSHTIREYRYSGTSVDNYIYYNCPDLAGEKNYGEDDYDYENNCEVWRIVGIFEENGEEYLKIMNNNTLIDIPTTYVIDNTTYTVGNNGKTAYWNKPDTLRSINYNDWTTAGLQYYLNTEQDESPTPVSGYLRTLSSNAKSLIREVTHYLGNITHDNDTTVNAYQNERDSDNKWEGNKETWNGKVALLYPSDYGYSASPINWNNTKIYDYSDETVKTKTWMMQTANHNSAEWFLSPLSTGSNYALNWDTHGNLLYASARVNRSVREVLNLKSNIKVLKGNGNINFPYVVIE